MSIEQSELREKIAREIRLAMVDNPTAGTFRERQNVRERVAYFHADAILAALPPSQGRGGEKCDNIAIDGWNCQSCNDALRQPHPDSRSPELPQAHSKP